MSRHNRERKEAKWAALGLRPYKLVLPIYSINFTKDGPEPHGRSVRPIVFAKRLDKFEPKELTPLGVVRVRRHGKRNMLQIAKGERRANGSSHAVPKRQRII